MPFRAGQFQLSEEVPPSYLEQSVTFYLEHLP